MLKSAFSSPKIRALAARLGIPFPQALGICGLLWNFVADHAPQGDVGRHDDLTIAMAVEWSGEPATLVAALVQVRLVDASANHRLVIHDWHEHCPRYVHAKLARSNREVLTPCNCDAEAPVATVERTTERTVVATVERSVVPTVVATVVPTTSSSSSTSSSTSPSSSNKYSRPKTARENSGVAWTPENGFEGIDLVRLGWQKAFPAIDLEATLRHAHVWLEANEKRRRPNYQPFLVRWLGDANEKAMSKNARKKTRKGW